MGTNGSRSLGKVLLRVRGEGGVGFLVKECLASGVELIKDVN